MSDYLVVDCAIALLSYGLCDNFSLLWNIHCHLYDQRMNRTLFPHSVP